MTSSLAVHGGTPTIKKEFPRFNTFDNQEIDAASNVLKSGNLSSYLGSPGEKFYGGEQVLNFESEFAEEFKVKNAISVNSWTSGLWAIIGALDLEPGSEVLVSSWTMAATATTILHWGLIPVFTDIDPLTFNMDFEDICRKTTKRTRAIVSPDIFGLSAENIKIEIEKILPGCKFESVDVPNGVLQNNSKGYWEAWLLGNEIQKRELVFELDSQGQEDYSKPSIGSKYFNENKDQFFVCHSLGKSVKSIDYAFVHKNIPVEHMSLWGGHCRHHLLT